MRRRSNNETHRWKAPTTKNNEILCWTNMIEYGSKQNSVESDSFRFSDVEFDKVSRSNDVSFVEVEQDETKF
ncbi:hypothetical protein AB6A40_008469 [Gnathostoma spinigerum]|uniref:Uncharacterized protein n=1 Tax=Gnathostoma spinigerum TaxID=75299 RepID=A0ABD6EQF3_9BILA